MPQEYQLTGWCTKGFGGVLKLLEDSVAIGMRLTDEQLGDVKAYAVRLHSIIAAHGDDQDDGDGQRG